MERSAVKAGSCSAIMSYAKPEIESCNLALKLKRSLTENHKRCRDAVNLRLRSHTHVHRPSSHKTAVQMQNQVGLSMDDNLQEERSSRISWDGGGLEAWGYSLHPRQ